MKSFSQILNEIESVLVSRVAGGSVGLRASKHLKNIADDAKDEGKSTKRAVRRIGQIGNDFSVFLSKTTAAPQLVVLVVHRPTNTVAVELTMKRTSKTGSNGWRVTMITAAKEYRRSQIGFSLAQSLYKFLNEKGYTIVTGGVQSDGGESIWRGLMQDAEAIPNIQVMTPTRMQRFKSGMESGVWLGDAGEAELEALQGAKRTPEQDKRIRQLQKIVRTTVSLRGKRGKIDPPEVRRTATAGQQFPVGSVWRTENKKWGAKSGGGSVKYFDSRSAAQAFTKTT